MLRARAVARFRLKWNLVGRSIGRSVGRAPRRMRSVRLAVRRNTASKSGPEEDDAREEIAARVGLAEPRDRRLHYFVRCPVLFRRSGQRTDSLRRRGR